MVIMKKYLSIFVFSIFGMSLLSAPIYSINQELNKDTVSQFNQAKAQTISTCLTCSKDSCELKEWPKDKQGDETVCKILYCTPSYVSKFFKKPDNVKSGKTRIDFTYSINKKGKIKDISVTSSKGVMNKRESYKYLQSFTAKTKFQPLMVNDNLTRIISLKGEHVAYTGKYEDVDKTMPVNQGIWRN